MDADMRDRFIQAETRLEDHMKDCAKQNSVIWKRLERNSLETKELQQEFNNTVKSIGTRFVLMMLTFAGTCVFVIFNELVLKR